jgi:phosphoribosylamine--glycine ligase
MAAEGYPEEYEKGKVIDGLDKVECCDVFAFHAGTTLKDAKVVTNGGRVLGVTALGDGIREAIDKAYHAVEKISWPGNHEDGGAYYRRDIGIKALKR